MKLIQIALLCGSFVFSGCSSLTEWVANHRPQIAATQAVIKNKVADVVKQVVIPAAVSQFDKTKKTDFVSALAQGFRTYQGTGKILSAEDVKNIVDAWTPEKAHWDVLGVELATLWAKENPVTPEQTQKILELIARGLDSAVTEA